MKLKSFFFGTLKTSFPKFFFFKISSSNKCDFIIELISFFDQLKSTTAFLRSKESFFFKRNILHDVFGFCSARNCKPLKL